MGLTPWFGRGDQGCGRGRDARRAGRRLRPATVEGLEGRQLLSTFRWENMGNNDDFQLIQGGTANQAREVVQAAMDAWEDAVFNFNYAIHAPGEPPNGDEFTLTITVRDLGLENPTLLGHVIDVDRHIDGKPYAATIEVDDDAAGNGWYVDTVHFNGQENDYFVDHAEFTNVTSRFRASGSGLGGTDLYSLVLHEIGHAVGVDPHTIDRRDGQLDDDLDWDADDHPEPDDDFAPTGLTDGGFDVVTYTKSQTYTMTLKGGGHFLTSAHSNDLMNSGLGVNERYLISDLDVQLLKDAFGYSVSTSTSGAPGLFLETFLAVLDESTHVLTVRGERSGFQTVDQILLDRGQFFGRVTADVNGARAYIDESRITQVRIEPGPGLNNIDIEKTSAAHFVGVNSGGKDLVRLSPKGKSLGLIQGTVSLKANGFAVELEVHDENGPGNATYELDDGSLVASTQPGTGVIFFQDVQDIDILGGPGANTYEVEAARPDSVVRLFGGGGSERFVIASASHDLDDLFEASVKVIGNGGTDVVEVHDDSSTDDSTFRLTDARLLLVGQFVPEAKVDYEGVEDFQLYAGSGKDTFNIEGTHADTSVEVVGGNGFNKFFISPTAKDLDTIAGPRLDLFGGTFVDQLEVHDENNDVTSSGYLLELSVLTRTAGAAKAEIFFGSSIDQLQVFGGRGAENTYSARGVLLGNTASLHGGPGNDRFLVTPISSNLESLGGQLTIDGNIGVDLVDVFDGANFAPSTYEISGGQLQRKQARVGYADVEVLTLSGGTAGNTYEVHGVPANTQVIINARAGDDTLLVAPDSKNLDAIVGRVDFNGNVNFNSNVESNRVKILDADSTLDATYTLGPSLPGFLLTRVAGGKTAQVGYSKVKELEIVGGGTARNDFVVDGTPVSTSTTLTGGAGPNKFVVGLGLNSLNGIGGPVRVIGGSSPFDALQLYDGANPDTTTYTVTSSSVSRKAGTQSARVVNYEGIEGMSVFGGSGSNTFTVESTPAITSMSLNGGAGPNKFFVGSGSNNLDGVAGLVRVVGGASSLDSLQVLDGGNIAPATYTITSGSVERTAGSTAARVDYLGVEGLSVFGDGPGGNTFNVESTPAQTFVSVRGGAGLDDFNISPTAGWLAQVAEMLTVLGNGGADTLDVFDQKSQAAASYHLSVGMLADHGQARINYGGIATLTLFGSAAPSNTYDVEATAAATRLGLNGGTGYDAFRIAPTTHNLDAIAGEVSVSGGNGAADSLTIDDAANAAAAAYTLDAATLRRQAGSAARVDYSGIEKLDLLAGTGSDVLTVDAVPSAADVTFAGGKGFETIEGGVAGQVFDLDGVNAGVLTFPNSTARMAFSATENLATPAAGTVRLRDADRLTGIVDGRGLATLDYSARTAGVVVDLAAGTATDVAAAVGVLNVLGGAAADRLTGSADSNLIVGNGGDDRLVGGAGVDILVGGEGNDTLDGGADRDILIGGRGADALRGDGGHPAARGIIPDGFDDDLLVGGGTAFDADLAALGLIRVEWASAVTYADRVGHLRGTLPGGANAHVFLRTSGPNPTVFDDAIADLIEGQNGQDWYLALAAEVADREPGELLN